ncbi:MAG: GHKL domain-containing protein [Turicibacter sp.]|nr:GHKL domain-containing protein [Turicibacter sp.]
MRAFKHDYQNILSSFEAYFEDGDYEQLKAYYYGKVKRVSDDLLAHDFKLEQLNRLKILELKSIFANKLMLAGSLGVDFTFELKEDITAIDAETVVLVRSIGIMLDNAIEAVSALGSGLVRIALFQEGKTLSLIIENDCMEGLPKIHQLKQAGFSTKGEGRGLGLSNLSGFVSQSPHLNLETTAQNGKFTQRLLISQGG